MLSKIALLIDVTFLSVNMLNGNLTQMVGCGFMSILSMMLVLNYENK